MAILIYFDKKFCQDLMINKEQKYELFNKFSRNTLAEYCNRLTDLYYGRAELVQSLIFDITHYLENK